MFGVAVIGMVSPVLKVFVPDGVVSPAPGGETPTVSEASAGVAAKFAMTAASPEIVTVVELENGLDMLAFTFPVQLTKWQPLTGVAVIMRGLYRITVDAPAGVVVPLAAGLEETVS